MAEAECFAVGMDFRTGGKGAEPAVVLGESGVARQALEVAKTCLGVPPITMRADPCYQPKAVSNGS